MLLDIPLFLYWRGHFILQIIHFITFWFLVQSPSLRSQVLVMTRWCYDRRIWYVTVFHSQGRSTIYFGNFESCWQEVLGHYIGPHVWLWNSNHFNYWSWAAGLAKWWEHSPLIDVVRVLFPNPASYVGWVCFWFPPFSEGFSPDSSVFLPPEKPTFLNCNSTGIENPYGNKLNWCSVFSIYHFCRIKNRMLFKVFKYNT